MEELKELLEAIGRQLASIDMKLSVIANSAQGPMIPGRTQYHFGVAPFGVVPVMNVETDPEPHSP